MKFIYCVAVFKRPMCEEQPCWNAGTCVDNPQHKKGYYCLCPSGWEAKYDCGRLCPDGYFGPNCLMQCYECDMRHCHPVTGCSVCLDGFKSPPLCNVLDCTSTNNPCFNNGYCIPKAKSCNCKPGYTGLLCQFRAAPEMNDKLRECEEEERLTMNCQNGGTCFIHTHRSRKSAYCYCTKQYVGTRCTDKCETRSQLCMYGSCVTEQGEQEVCRCDPGWSGPHCNKKCPFGLWGESCKKSCGQCLLVEESCDPTNGYCATPSAELQLCQEFWKGPRCLDYTGPFEARNEIEAKGRAVLHEVMMREDWRPWDVTNRFRFAVREWIIESIAKLQIVKKEDIKATILSIQYKAASYEKEPLKHIIKRQVANNSSSSSPSSVELFFKVELPKNKFTSSQDIGKTVSQAMKDNVDYIEKRIPSLRVDPDSITAVQVIFPETSLSQSETSSIASFLRGWRVYALTFGIFALVLLMVIVALMVKCRRSEMHRQRTPTVHIRRFRGLKMTTHRTQ